MAIIHSLSPGFKNQVSGVGCQVSGEKNVRAETQKPRVKLHLKSFFFDQTGRSRPEAALV
jgi:hypothetical protein